MAKKNPSSGELGNLYLPQCINYINVQTNGTRGDILRSHIKNEKRGRLTLLCTLWMRCKCAAHLATAGSRCDQSVVRNMAALLAVRICWEEHHCRWSHRHLITSCALTDTCMWMCWYIYFLFPACLNFMLSTMCVFLDSVLSVFMHICGSRLPIASQRGRWISWRIFFLVLRGAATCCLHYKPPDHKASCRSLCQHI